MSSDRKNNLDDTTRIPLPQGDEEITLVGDAPEDNKEDTVTQRLSLPSKLQNPQHHDEVKPDTQDKIDVVSKLSEIFSRLSAWFVLMKRLPFKKICLIAGSMAVFVAIVWIFQFAYTDKAQMYEAGKTSVAVRTSRVFLTAPFSSKVIDHKKIQVGDAFDLNFLIKSWDDRFDEASRFTIGLKIYAASGQLIHYQPAFAKFGQDVDQTAEEILVTSRFFLSRRMQAGYYRIVLTVTQDETKQKSIVQTRVRVSG